MTPDHQLSEQAIAWAVRTGDPAFDAWEEFTVWLEGSPAHAAAYDAAVADVADMAALVPPEPTLANGPTPANGPVPANDDEAAPHRRRWIGGSIAAALAVVALVGVQQWRTGTYAVQTAPGETRIVQLDGGDTITLAGGTRLVLKRDNPRVAALDHGRALFNLRAPGKEPMVLTVGQDRLVDVGTVFDVAKDGRGMAVAVSEGAVMFDPDGQKVRVAPGQMLRHAAGADRYDLSPIAPELVGEWAEGRLTFEDATLADVAAELNRATGQHFTAAAPAGGQTVSGSIVIAPVRADPRSIGPLLGVSVQRTGDSWLIGAP